jgi:DNA-damage-inducible protein J
VGYNKDMPENAVVRSRIDPAVKRQATAVLSTLGLSVSDVIRVVLTRVARERALPFDWNPNAVTRATLKKSARGQEVHVARNAKDLFKQLDI